MFKTQVLAHFGDSPIAIARALGITRSAVCQWKERVPLRMALKLESLTGGALRVDRGAYDLPEAPSSRRVRREQAITP